MQQGNDFFLVRMEYHNKYMELFIPMYAMSSALKSPDNWKTKYTAHMDSFIKDIIDSTMNSLERISM